MAPEWGHLFCANGQIDITTAAENIEDDPLEFELLPKPDEGWPNEDCPDPCPKEDCPNELPLELPNGLLLLLPDCEPFWAGCNDWPPKPCSGVW